MLNKAEQDNGYSSNKIAVLLTDILTKRSRKFGIVFSLASLFIVAYLDYLTGNETLLTLFYLLPIFSASWFLSTRWSVSMSVLSALAFVLVETAGGRVYSSIPVAVWNGITILGVFLVLGTLLTSLKSAYLNERELARMDVMTGIANRKMFYEEFERETYRAKRYKRPITVAYIDLDDFKKVNDTLGHNKGDELLILIADTIKTKIRTSDTAARMGGDEFVLLLPETGETQAKTVVDGLFSALNREIKKGRWPVSLSIGVLTCASSACEPEDIIKKADAIMYLVKKSGKNNVKYRKI